MIQKLQISHSNSLLDYNSQMTRNWFYYLFKGRIAEYNRLKKLKRIDYWWIEIDDINNSIIRQIPFDILKYPIRGLSDVKLNLDSIKPIKNINRALFNDIWSIYEKYDFHKLEQMISKYLKKWKSPDKFDPPIFPSIIIDLKYPKDIIELETIEELVGQVDFFGYEWSDSERLIDSKGNMYSTEYLNFGHPVGVVLPDKIDGRITKEELIQLIGDNKLNFEIID
ncbi:hypothetical protein [Sphingobacterium sp.]|uniref:hypothetical protein n=1 Tax=Sphingobacterium sp. TaxID=341027 RepID=UPI0028991DE9|nr:hypothetical protein [Sphingobacterium sp.]